MIKCLLFFFFGLSFFKSSAQQNIFNYFVSDTQVEFEDSKGYYSILPRTTGEANMVTLILDSIKVSKQSFLIYGQLNKKGETKLYYATKGKSNIPKYYKSSELFYSKINDTIAFNYCKGKKSFLLLIETHGYPPTILEINFVP